MIDRSALEWSAGALGPLLAALADPGPDLSWQDAVACQYVDPELFYPEKGSTTLPAKKVCAGCPVREPCLQFALDNDERFGVFGGMSERERRRLKRSRGRSGRDGLGEAA